MERLSTPAAAKHIGVKPGTLETWRWQGRGPKFLKIGSLVQYRQKDLDAYLEGQVRTSTSDPGAGDARPAA